MTDKNKDVKEHYATTFDIPRATMGEITKHLTLSLRAQQHRGAFVIVGEAGIGKSQIVAQIGRQHKAKVYDVRTAHYGLVGAGIPSTKDAPPGYFDIVVPSVFPKPGEKSIMLFEEINQGLPHAISMFFSLVEDRRMFNYELPDECVVVALMNPDTAMYAVTQIENNAALRRRLKWVYAIESFKGWIEHAETPEFHMSDVKCLGDARPCHPGILDFIRNHGSLLYDKRAQQAGKQYICPATIQTISLDAYILEREKISLTAAFARTRFASSIGETVTTQLIEFLRDHSIKVRPVDLFKNYSKVRKAVQRLLTNKEHDKVGELSLDALTYMFGVQPKVDKAAKNLLGYLKDLPNEMRTPLMSGLKKSADEAGAGDYLYELMKELQKPANEKGWLAVHSNIETGLESINEELKDGEED